MVSIDLSFNSPKTQNKVFTLSLFCLSLKSATLDRFSDNNISAVKNEGIVYCKDFEWSSFMRLLGL